MISFLFQSLFLSTQLPQAFRFFSALKQVQVTQDQMLRAYLRQNQNTQFGKEHHFGDIRNISTFRQQVPVRTYQEFLPYLEQIKQGKPRILTNEETRYFLPTGGTTGTKLIPYTDSLKREFQRAIAPWLVDIAWHFPSILNGKTYWTITPPGTRLHQDVSSHIPVGFEDDAAYFGWKGRLLGTIFAAPAWVTQMQPIENFRFLTLYFLLKAANLRWLSIWSPTFLLMLLDELDTSIESLLASLSDGVLYLPIQEGKLIPSQQGKKRAKELEKLFALPLEERYGRIWPKLQFISLWDAAYARYPAQQVQTYFSQAHCQGKGLLATEGVVSIPLHQAGGCVPALTSHVFEFLTDAGEARSLWELESGQTYSVLLTTGGGLYRYDIGDLVQVTGFYHSLPLLRFCGRKGRFCDLAGEKLEESFVNTTLEQGLSTCPVKFVFLLIAPEVWENRTQGYVLFLESSDNTARLHEFVQHLEHYFRKNIHYQIAVQLKQISPLQVFRIERNGRETYLQRCLASGQKLGDIKPLTFDIRTGWKQRFEGAFL